MSKRLSIKAPLSFWTDENGLTSMFVLLCISNFVVMPFFTERLLIIVVLRVIWFALLVAGIITLSKNRAQKMYFSIIPLLMIVMIILRLFWDFSFQTWADFIIDIITFSLLIGMVLVKVFSSGPVTIHRVVGAIVAYMLIGNLGAVIFRFTYLILPDSFSVPAVYAESGVSQSVFLYFSYTTLTTTGYGEITPVHSVARTIVSIEQLIGVLYPAVLIGRLVGLVTGGGDDSEK